MEIQLQELKGENDHLNSHSANLENQVQSMEKKIEEQEKSDS